MGNRIFVGVVVVLWAGTMSWLMVARILPPFFHGDPPTHGVLVRDAPSCWEIFYGGRSVGHAVSQAVPGAGDDGNPQPDFARRHHGEGARAAMDGRAGAGAGRSFARHAQRLRARFTW